jgi:hypothetical protein
MTSAAERLFKTMEEQTHLLREILKGGKVS